ncbi:TRAP transporter substrate-binding protein [uncultured Treponema sp.]|uniref:TRAP transporter substrate-binding protein n=1 Tax=uncultured Treponema sp. TaxID=162155 RepID=UPI0025ECBF25|nr:TRAP transporter substrate-binding protein [uncultured Treponema sp.]
MGSTKSKFFIFMAFSAMLTLFPSCKKSYLKLHTLSPKTAVKPDFVMHVGHAQTEESVRHRSLLYFKEQVEVQSEGKIGVEIFPNGIIGGESEMTVAVSEGKLEAVRGGDLDVVPKARLLGLPMIADSLIDARKLCYSNFVKDMLSSAESKNMMVLAVGDDSGFHQITNSVRPIIKPEDMKGLTIRSPQSSATVNFLNAVGAQASVVPFTELYAALAIGLVSGQENPLAIIDSSKIYEVQKYCTIINYQFFPELMFVNKDWWNSLPEEYQNIITICARKMMFENAKMTDAENEAYIEHIQANGCKVVTLTKEQRAAFFPYAKRVWKSAIDAGEISEKELKQILKIIGKNVNW